MKTLSYAVSIECSAFNRQPLVLTCMNFEHGVTVAEQTASRLGLIGRVYVTGSCGKSTWFWPR